MWPRGNSVIGYSVFQTLPSLFPPPLSPPTNYQTEGLVPNNKLCDITVYLTNSASIKTYAGS